MAQLFVGLSGFSYKPWQGEGRFYPAGLKQKEFFAYYAKRYNAVEMDGTWYRMPAESAVKSWLEGAPEGFRYTFKAHRSITHIRRLKPESLESVTFQLDRLKPLRDGGKLGAVFFQLPPNFKRNDERLQEFVEALPQGWNYAIEFRNESWHHEATDEILKSRGIAWASWDTGEAAGQRRDTGTTIYTRLRRSSYSDEQLESWAKWFREMLESGKDVHVFFKHEDEGSPWIDADRLLERMKKL
ncbi:MAG TPA: DUF72 domain-containing protein [Fimbriimonadaceae bacterium]|nr:DUF72 domain-containing protein [Fimbriimonadaceae bacterium]